MDTYSWVKALHLVSMVSWFAGMFYSVRLFIYHVEAMGKSDAERAILLPQYSLMEKRLWRGITTPAMIGTVVFGAWLTILIQAWTQPWFQVKMVLVAGLLAYHGVCGRIRRQLALGQCRWTSGSLRIWNEVATLFLFTIVFTAIFKRPLGAAMGLISVLVLGVLGVSVLFFARRGNK